MENISYTYPGRQHDSLVLFAENWRDKISRTNADLKENLGVSTWAGGCNYCKEEYSGNIGEETRNRLVSFEVVKSASKLLILEAGSQKTWHRSLSPETISQESISIPSICIDSQSTK